LQQEFQFYKNQNTTPKKRNEIVTLSKLFHYIKCNQIKLNIMKKKEIIKKIKSIIENHGSFSVMDVNSESSPIISSVGKDSCILAERFSTTVTVVTYIHETEVCEDELEYEKISKDVLEEILSIAEIFESEFL